MEQRHERRDSFRQQIIYELLIERNAGWVNGVFAATDRDDSAPGDGEAVGFRAGEFEKRNVFCGSVVGVAGYIAGTAVCYFAGDFAECVPDGGASSVGFRGAFDLVAGAVRNLQQIEGMEHVPCCCKTPEEVFWEDWFDHRGLLFKVRLNVSGAHNDLGRKERGRGLGISNLRSVV